MSTGIPDSPLYGQGVICGEDDNMFTNGLTHLHEQLDLFRFSCSEVFGLSTVNMKNIVLLMCPCIHFASVSARRIRGQQQQYEEL